MRIVAILASALLATGCDGPGEPLTLQAQRGEGHLWERLEVGAWSWDDPFGGKEGAIGLMVRLRNTSEEMLGHCQLGFNGDYWARLEELEVYRGFLGGNQPRGRSDLRRGQAATFKFHHDNNNNLLLRGSEGSYYPVDMLPSVITVVCNGDEATWHVIGNVPSNKALHQSKRGVEGAPLRP